MPPLLALDGPMPIDLGCEAPPLRSWWEKRGNHASSTALGAKRVKPRGVLRPCRERDSLTRMPDPRFPSPLLVRGSKMLVPAPSSAAGPRVGDLRAGRSAREDRIVSAG